VSQDKSKSSITVFLVEDNAVDAMGMLRAFSKANLCNTVVVASDGIDALSKLRDGKTVQKPYVILLDLNMPRMNGIEFLREIRVDDALKDAVVFVLSTSSAASDRRTAFAQNIAGYIVKGGETNGFLNVAGLLDQYARVCELPP
jgi:CheY-like chemotaxis protein